MARHQRNQAPVGATSVGDTDATTTNATSTTGTTAGTWSTPVRNEVVGRRDDTAARDKFGGLNIGSCIFGWLVTLGVAALLTGIVSAVVAAFDDKANVTQSDADRAAGTIGIGAAVVLLVVLLLGYYAGGYVAGRMSRFDGGRQGFGVWVVGIVITVIAAAVGAIFGTKYNVFDRVDLPNIPIDGDHLGWGLVITAVAVIVVTLVAAVLGGKVGHHYHDRVDKAVARGTH